jgi:arylsulfatase A-like enzyme
MRGTRSPQRALLLESWSQAVYPVSYRGVRTARYKYIRYSTGDRSLFDLSKDPDELHNLAAEHSAAPTLHILQRDLARLQRCAGATCQVEDSLETVR